MLEGLKVGAKASFLPRIVECPVFYPVPGLAKVMGKLLDSVQKCQHFLAVVGSVAELFT